MKISAIILSRNENERLREAVHRIFTYVDHITIVMDDDDDSSVLVARYLIRDYGKVGIAVCIKEDTFDDRRNKGQDAENTADWFLHVDVDELFDNGFLSNMRNIISENSTIECFRFARINLPGGYNFPDYQVRLLKNMGNKVVWYGDKHEILMDFRSVVDLAKDFGKRLDEKACKTLPYNIIHLPRRTDINRPWWNETKTVG